MLDTTKYIPVHAFTHKPSIAQVLAIATALVELLVHILCVLPNVASGDIVHPFTIKATTVLLYICFACVIVLYLYLSFFDPVDEGVYTRSHPTDATPGNLTNKYCMTCECHVALASKHCSVCNRCCFEFDHHCVFLNNCIGSKNYRAFVALLLFCIASETLFVFQGVKSVVNPSTGWILYVIGSEEGCRYATYLSLALACFILLFVLALSLFHLSIRCIFALSTFSWLKRQRAQQQNGSLKEITYGDNKDIIANEALMIAMSQRPVLN